MAKKITAIVCGVCWAIFGISVALPVPCLNSDPNFCLPAAITNPIAVFSTVALIIMAIIDYARRPRKEC